ncbi:PadR family transcriptional regulator [Paraburkholderia sediminicola]|uniref:PadR family transcriptional regulator n=2 Tax=Paraburkholderia TaxID=1822464 RepID=UPI0038BB26EC
MRHQHRFSRSRGADDGFFAGHDRPSLHALWHAFARHYTFGGERGGEARGEGFDRRRGGRGDRYEFHGDERGRGGRHEFHGDERGYGRHGGRGERGERDDRGGFGYGHDRFSLHALWHAIGRHHEHRGGGRGGRFGGGPGGFGGDGDGFPRGRKFSSDDLQLLLLSMIEAQPSHGYELIKALETRSNGFYSPSPGMVYPALTYLEELGYVTVQLEGNRKRYELSETGREYLGANRDRVELMLAKLTHIARKMDSVRRAFAGEEPADISEGGWLPELSEARRALKHALLRRDNVPADEQRRIAAILMRATKEIEGEGNPGSDEGGGEFTA